MWTLRVRASNVPSGATTMAVLKPEPAVGRSLVQRAVYGDAVVGREDREELVGGTAGQRLGLDARRCRLG